jgi:hypothetical protein
VRVAAFSSDDRVETHSNMRTVVLCRISRARFHRLVDVRQEKYTAANGLRERKEAKRVNGGYRRVEVHGRLNSFAFQALLAETETRAE